LLRRLGEHGIAHKRRTGASIVKPQIGRNGGFDGCLDGVLLG
jgi:hypothetical protein